MFESTLKWNHMHVHSRNATKRLIRDIGKEINAYWVFMMLFYVVFPAGFVHTYDSIMVRRSTAISARSSLRRSATWRNILEHTLKNVHINVRKTLAGKHSLRLIIWKHTCGHTQVCKITKPRKHSIYNIIEMLRNGNKWLPHYFRWTSLSMSGDEMQQSFQHISQSEVSQENSHQKSNRK